MLRTALWFVCGLVCLHAETHRLTLRETVALALRQNPDVVLARIDAQRARDAVRVAKDPFFPKVFGGSGLAYTYGYPTSIDGNPPSIFDVRTNMTLFNRQKTYELAQAKENARGTVVGTVQKSEEVVYQTAALYLDTMQLVRSQPSLQTELESLELVAQDVKARVEEGREIPLEGKRSQLNLARSRQRSESLASDLDYSEAALAVIVGLPANDRIEPRKGDTLLPEVPESADRAVTAALQNSQEIRRLRSQLQAKGLEIRGYRAARLPEIDLVAQYSLLSTFNHFQDYLRQFQRNNAELGASFQIPLLVGSAARGYLSQAEDDAARIQTQMNSARNQIALNTARAYENWHKATTAAEVSRLDLDVAREQVSVFLAQLAEGRVSRQSVDQARSEEQEKWLAFYESQHAIEKARLLVLKETGTLVAGLQ